MPADGLRLALTTFTVAPAAPPEHLDRRVAGQAMRWAPLVGAAVAVVAAGVLFTGRNVFQGPTVWVHAVHTELFLPPLLASILAVATVAVLTRGLHLDGLADTVDGLASHRPAAEALEIMRDGRAGALAAVALVFVLLIDVTALSVSVLGDHGTQALVMAVLTGRVAMLWACTPSVPAARSDGMGALVAGTVSPAAAAGWTAVALTAAAVYGRFDTEVGSWHGSARAVGAVVAALLVAWGLRVHAVRRLGGITGDVLGALCEAAVLVSLVVSASGRP